MKKITVLLILILSLSEAFEIQKSNEFIKEVEPTMMSTSITAMVEDESKLEIQKIFEKAIQCSKEQKICTNGSYRISPSYSYVDKKRVFLGYRGSIAFDCKFQDSKKLDSVISKLDSVSGKEDKLKLTINPIRWIVEKKTYEEIDKELELKALYYAKEYKSFLSTIYASECKIKEIFLNSANRFINQERAYHVMGDAKSQTTPPIKSTHIIKYSASYKFECN